MPSRTAGHVYWLGRHAERAEQLARTLDVSEFVDWVKCRAQLARGVVLASIRHARRSIHRSPNIEHENLQAVATAASGDTEGRAALLHAELRYGTLATLAPHGSERFLRELLDRTADLSDRIGRDYLDAVPVRGVRRGGGKESMTVTVRVADDPGEQQ